MSLVTHHSSDYYDDDLVWADSQLVPQPTARIVVTSPKFDPVRNDAEQLVLSAAQDRPTQAFFTDNEYGTRKQESQRFEHPSYKGAPETQAIWEHEIALRTVNRNKNPRNSSKLGGYNPVETFVAEPPHVDNIWSRCTNLPPHPLN
ncbi:MAG TPA: hypothetical protein VNR69_02220 [Microbacterium sp.]|nr:hypothetical protein [Microbacterium sp.]HWK76523.1 hypothetical protein [Microbacterium sp.]